MSPHDEDPGLSFDAEVERALAQATRPVARAEFEWQLRERFLAVDPDLRAAASGVGTLRAAASGEARDTAPLGSSFGQDARPPRRLWRLGALGAAAAVLLVLFALRPRGSRWSLVDPDSSGASGVVRVDGVAFPVAGRARLEEALNTGSLIETTESSVRLRLGDVYLVELPPRSRIALPTRASRSEPLAVNAERGAFRICTGPGFTGSHMRVSTSDLDLRVTGTSFAVDLLEPDRGTCVCCIGGTVEVRAPMIPEPKPITEGRMCVVWRDKSIQPKWAAVLDPHVGPLRELEACARKLWPR